MDRLEDRGTKSLVELGTASTDTQGAAGHIMEPGGLWMKEGISQD
jgi:hypothetical protein